MADSEIFNQMDDQEAFKRKPEGDQTKADTGPAESAVPKDPDPEVGSLLRRIEEEQENLTQGSKDSTPPPIPEIVRHESPQYVASEQQSITSTQGVEDWTPQEIELEDKNWEYLASLKDEGKLPNGKVPPLPHRGEQLSDFKQRVDAWQASQQTSGDFGLEDVGQYNVPQEPLPATPLQLVPDYEFRIEPLSKEAEARQRAIDNSREAAERYRRDESRNQDSEDFGNAGRWADRAKEEEEKVQRIEAMTDEEYWEELNEQYQEKLNELQSTARRYRGYRSEDAKEEYIKLKKAGPMGLLGVFPEEKAPEPLQTESEPTPPPAARQPGSLLRRLEQNQAERMREQIESIPGTNVQDIPAWFKLATEIESEELPLGEPENSEIAHVAKELKERSMPLILTLRENAIRSGGGNAAVEQAEKLRERVESEEGWRYFIQDAQDVIARRNANARRTGRTSGSRQARQPQSQEEEGGVRIRNVGETSTRGRQPESGGRQERRRRVGVGQRGENASTRDASMTVGEFLSNRGGRENRGRHGRGSAESGTEEGRNTRNRGSVVDRNRRGVENRAGRSRREPDAEEPRANAKRPAKEVISENMRQVAVAANIAGSFVGGRAKEYGGKILDVMQAQAMKGMTLEQKKASMRNRRQVEKFFGNLKESGREIAFAMNPQDAREWATISTRIAVDYMDPKAAYALAIGNMVGMAGKELYVINDIWKKIEAEDEEGLSFAEKAAETAHKWFEQTAAGKLIIKDENSKLEIRQKLLAGAIGTILGTGTSFLGDLAVKFTPEESRSVARVALTRLYTQVLVPRTIDALAGSVIARSKNLDEEGKREWVETAVKFSKLSGIITTSALTLQALSENSELAQIKSEVTGKHDTWFQDTQDKIDKGWEKLGDRLDKSFDDTRPGQEVKEVGEEAKEIWKKSGENSENIFERIGNFFKNFSERNRSEGIVPILSTSAPEIDEPTMEQIVPDRTPLIDETELPLEPPAKLDIKDVEGGHLKVDNSDPNNPIVWGMHSDELGLDFAVNPHAAEGGESWAYFQVLNDPDMDPNASIEDYQTKALELMKEYKMQHQDLPEGSSENQPLVNVGKPPEGYSLTKTFDTDGDGDADSAWYEDKETHEIGKARLSDGSEWDLNKDEPANALGKIVGNQFPSLEPDFVKDTAETIASENNLETVEAVKNLDLQEVFDEVVSKVALNELLDKLDLPAGAEEAARKLFDSLQVKIDPNIDLQDIKDMKEVLPRVQFVDSKGNEYNWNSLLDKVKSFVPNE